MQHGVMFGAGRDHVFAALLQGGGNPENRLVVRLGAAAGKHYFPRPAVQYRRHPVPGFIQRKPGFLAHGVDAGWVAVALGEIR